MKRYWLFTLVALPIVLLLLSAEAQSGGDKTTASKSFLSDSVYKQLSERSIQTIEATAKADAKNALGKIEVEAAILAAYTFNVADPKNADVSMLRGAALQAARAVKEKDLTLLKEFGKLSKGGVLAPVDVKLLKARMPAIEDLMEIFRNKSKGGEGLPAELQYQAKLKNLNGIEALIGALGAKKLNDENLEKVSKELPLLAYRVAVVGVLTHESAPEKNAGQWRDLSLKMRDASIALADAAQKKNGEGIVQSAVSLENTCTQCHSAFKSK
jgi:hypothetical protein